MKSKMNIKSIVIIAAVCIISLFFINMSLAANTGKIIVDTANLRETADEDSKILELLSMNKEVEVIEKTNNWYKVKVDGITGYLREDLLTVSGEEKKEENTTQNTQTTPEETTTPVTTTEPQTPAEETTSELGKKIVVENVRLKIVPVINATDTIEVKKDEEVNVIEVVNGWACIETQNTKGWIRKDKLQEKVAATTTTAEQTATTEQPQVQITKVDKKLYVKSASINVRKDSTTSSSVVTSLQVNTEVNVVEELSNGWSKVKVNGVEGYILSTLLSTQKQETSRSQTTQRQPATTQTTTQASTTTAKTSTATKTADLGKGSTVIETAKKYLGYRYVYGGASPSTGFDCSGFTSYIYKQHGVSLSRTSQAQSKNGVAVNRSDLKPGDLVFFYSGISHVGIYIGGGSFIHASNSRTGVIISSLSSGHYSSNYKCARRVL